MPWKPITEQVVVANLGGKVRQLVVTAGNSDTAAVQVAWPLQAPSVLSIHRYSSVSKTKIERALYEPLDPDAFKAATTVSVPTRHALNFSLSLLADRT
jgi:hypothetical protein